MGDNVNHPNHYNAPGRKECIVEMLELFGTEKVQAFCELNAYKYHYRHEAKNGQEDLDKAKWYEEKQSYLEATDRRFQIASHYGYDNQSQQLIEEMAELTQAICKEKRSRKGQALGDYWKVEDIRSNLIEEVADVKLVLDQLIYILGCSNDIQEIINQKVERTIERMGLW